MNRNKKTTKKRGIAWFQSFACIVLCMAMLMPTIQAKAASKLSKYDWVSSFSNGLALVGIETKKGSYSYKYGYINKKGVVVAKLQYNAAHDFSENLAAVCKNGKWGYINKKGKTVVKPQYDSAEDFSEGLAAVYIKSKGFGYINKNGKFVIKPQKKIASAKQFSDGVAAVGIQSSNGQKYGLMNKKGKMVVQAKYDIMGCYAGGVSNGLSDGLIQVGIQDGQNFKYGFIDKNGKEVVKPKYDIACNFSEGLAAVGENEKGWGFIDTTGKEVIELKYGVFGSGGTCFSCGVASVVNNDGVILIDKNGKEVGGPVEGAIWVQPFSENLGVMWSANSLTMNGYVDKTGKHVITGYENSQPFSDGLGLVEKNGKRLFIDKTGKVVLK